MGFLHDEVNSLLRRPVMYSSARVMTFASRLRSHLTPLRIQISVFPPASPSSSLTLQEAAYQVLAPWAETRHT